MIQLAGLDPEVRPYAEAAVESARHYGIPVTVTSTRRTWSEQERLRARWDKCVADGHAYSSDPQLHCQYPANKPGESAHNYGLAWDSVVAPEYQAAWNAIRVWHGWRVLANDVIHAEVSSWWTYVDGWKGQVG